MDAFFSAIGSRSAASLPTIQPDRECPGTVSGGISRVPETTFGVDLTPEN